MNKFIAKYDYFWKGDRDTLLSMWAVIILATVLVAGTLFTAYVTFFK